jgi:hypothetical protein
MRVSTPRALHAQRAHQFLAKTAEGRAMQQDHALLAEPDVAGRERELQARSEVVHRARILLA